MDITETRPSAPQFAAAGALLEALAAGDFARLAVTLEADASLSALLPGGLREWRGADEIAAVFAGWFGDVDDYALVDAAVGQVGHRLQMRWRVRLRGARLGRRAKLVEQYVYADSAASGRIQSMALLCSGYCPEQVDA